MVLARLLVDTSIYDHGSPHSNEIFARLQVRSLALSVALPGDKFRDIVLSLGRGKARVCRIGTGLAPIRPVSVFVSLRPSSFVSRIRNSNGPIWPVSVFRSLRLPSVVSPVPPTPPIPCFAVSAWYRRPSVTVAYNFNP